MYRLNDSVQQYSELPFNELNKLKCSVFVLDFNWNYLFVNDYVVKVLGEKAEQLVGRNMWTKYKELDMNLVFRSFRRDTEKGMKTSSITTSPLTGKRLHIIGQPLTDCYFFSVTYLPDKEALITELAPGKKV